MKIFTGILVIFMCLVMYGCAGGKTEDVELKETRKEDAQNETNTEKQNIMRVSENVVALEEEEEIPGESIFGEENGILSFEDGTGGFTPRGTETVDTSADYARTGAKSLHVYNRTAAWNGPQIDVKKYAKNINVGAVIYFSAYVLAPNGAENIDVQMSAETRKDGNTVYKYLNGEDALKTVTPGSWTRLFGSFSYDEDFDEVFIYIETSGTSSADFYADDVRVTMTKGEEAMYNNNLTALKDAYADYFMIGTAVSQKDFVGTRKNLLTKQFNAVTAENMMKPEALQPTEGTFNFSDADKLVAFAQENGLTLIGHTLCWHQQTPAYMFALDLTREDAILNLRHHIKNTVGHFAGKVYSWDVVNEAFDDGVVFDGDWKHSLRKSHWRDVIGDDYIEIAFQTAREFDSSAKLYYNDYNLDFVEKSKAVAAMVKDFKSRGIPIDGVGMQGHYNSGTVVSNVEDSINRFIEADVKISITELDITWERARGESTLAEEYAKEQALKYAKLFVIFKNYSQHIERVTFWGIDDGTSWRGDRFPLLFDSGFNPKEAFFAVADPEKYIAGALAPIETKISARVSAGTPRVEIKNDGAWGEWELKVDNFITAWENGSTGKARLLWNDSGLYVQVEVDSPTGLDASADETSRQDSVEFVFDEGDGARHYLVNFKNEVSFGENAVPKGFNSFTDVGDKGFTVTVQIPFVTAQPKPEMRVGFDIKVNSAENGSLTNVAKWSIGDTLGDIVLE